MITYLQCILGPTYNEYRYNEHPNIWSNFSLRKKKRFFTDIDKYHL